jgi:hypothetical protein
MPLSKRSAFISTWQTVIEENRHTRARKAVTAFVFASCSLDCESDGRHRRAGFRVVVVI